MQSKPEATRYSNGLLVESAGHQFLRKRDRICIELHASTCNDSIADIGLLQ